jgi:hypothetical protein
LNRFFHSPHLTVVMYDDSDLWRHQFFLKYELAVGGKSAIAIFDVMSWEAMEDRNRVRSVCSCSPKSRTCSAKDLYSNYTVLLCWICDVRFQMPENGIRRFYNLSADSINNIDDYNTIVDCWLLTMNDNNYYWRGLLSHRVTVPMELRGPTSIATCTFRSRIRCLCLLLYITDIFLSLQDRNSTYRPVYHHWFYCKDIPKDGTDLRSVWKSFSMSDSLALEKAFSSRKYK